MTVRQICEKLGLKPVTGDIGMNREVKGVYICDLLSWVMAHAHEGNAWITIQTHTNIVAVATLLELSCIIIPEEAEIEEDTIKKAIEEGIPIMTSEENAFTITKKLINIGLGD